MNIEDIERWWLLVVLGVPFTALTAKNGYSTPLRNGDFSLFGISALVAVLFEWFIEQPASCDHFLRPGPNGEPRELSTLVGIMGLLVWNFWLFLDPKDRAFGHLNSAFLVTTLLVIGYHFKTALQTAAHSLAHSSTKH